MNFHTATKTLQEGQCVCCEGKRICLHDDEIWISGRIIISISEFICDYSDKEFTDYIDFDCKKRLQAPKSTQVQGGGATGGGR